VENKEETTGNTEGYSPIEGTGGGRPATESRSSDGGSWRWRCSGDRLATMRGLGGAARPREPHGDLGLARWTTGRRIGGGALADGVRLSSARSSSGARQGGGSWEAR
jgi:hypothetical protein